MGSGTNSQRDARIGSLRVREICVVLRLQAVGQNSRGGVGQIEALSVMRVAGDTDDCDPREISFRVTKALSDGVLPRPEFLGDAFADDRNQRRIFAIG